MGSSSTVDHSNSQRIDGLAEGVAGMEGVFRGPCDENPGEVVPSGKFPDPKMPSPEEIATHRIDHLPYRSWCKWCIMGRALGEQHQSSEEASSGLAVVLFTCPLHRVGLNRLEA